MSRGANQPSVGNYNQAVILEQIRRAGAMSRVELASITGLSAQTVSNICQRMIEAGIIAEGTRTTTTSGRGKPPTPLLLVGDSRFAVGVHVDPSVISTVLLALDGTVITHRRHPAPTAGEPAKTVRLISRQVERVLATAAVDRERVVGVGIAAPGPIDIERGVIVDPPNLGAWHRVPLQRSVSESTGLPVVLDKDVTAAAVAERWLSPTIRDLNFAFLYLGTGLGLGLVISGEVVRGGSGNAGEIGHIVVDPAGPPCSCGQRGCVAVTCTPAALVGEAERLSVLPRSRVGSDPRSVDDALSEIVSLARRGNALASDILERVGERISRMITVVCNLLDVDRVVVGGPLWARLSPWLESQIPLALTTRLAAHGIHDVEVVGTTLGANVGAIGAACLVLDDTLSPKTDSLLLS